MTTLREPIFYGDVAVWSRSNGKAKKNKAKQNTDVSCTETTLDADMADVFFHTLLRVED